VIADAFFLVSPFTREAAYWYAASTDLLAAAAGLGMLHALLSARPALAALALAVACLSKESAVVLPVLGALVLRGADPATPAPVILRRTAVLLPVLAAYGVVRTLVLGGIGGSGDVGAPAGAKLVQLASGWIHAFSASDVIAEPLAWILGGAGTIAAAAATWRARPRPWVPWCFVAVALAPLGAAPWIVGARYFYLAAVGVAWLVAIALGRAPAPAIVGVFGLLLGIGLAQDLARHGDVASYRARVAAARRAAVAGLAEGHATFHIDGGIKDLDLAVKEDPRAAARADTLLVLGDVPASFVLVPARRSADVDFLLARPPLPPSGAYRFGQQRIVGLARRGDEPSLDEVIRRFPDIRFIRLRLGPGGHIVPRDVTQSILRPDEP
jgi:hypothetical protein